MKRIIIIIVGVVLVGAVVFSILRPKDKSEAKVETGFVARKDLTSIVNCSGTIQPERQVDVSANAMGTIVNLAVVEGQRVVEGDLLLKIDPSEYHSVVLALESTVNTARADLRLAKASLAKARLDETRAGELFQSGLASQENLDAARDLIVAVKGSVMGPVVIGGSAIDATTSAGLGADGWASDGRAAIEAIAALGARS